MPLDLVMVLTRDDTGDCERSMEEFVQLTREQADKIYDPNTETTPIIFLTVDKESLSCDNYQSVKDDKEDSEAHTI